MPQPRPTTNPYVVQLLRSLESVPDVTVLTFSWRAALRANYDVFHVHWPENLLKGRSRAKGLARRTLTRLLLRRLRQKQIPIVRTLHNLDQPSGLAKADYRILARIDTRTAVRIRLNDLTPIDTGHASETIPHGHYRDWFSPHSQKAPIPGRLGYFGLIRRYKNVARLVSSAAALPPSFSLRVAGKPSTAELQAEIENAADGDLRITFDFHFLSDPELVEVVTESELVVLPYTEMHNSGSVLAALSLARPVLVPNNPLNQALSAEVGPGWVHLYDGELGADDVASTHAQLADHPPIGEPNLGSREWHDAGQRHLTAYQRAVGISGP
ncbi:MAG TPA: glycosyl transferase [Pseudolysinimonas sp.]|nr:glycosyl transferase [Pseudolysinimonas sp.]